MLVIIELDIYQEEEEEVKTKKKQRRIGGDRAYKGERWSRRRRIRRRRIEVSWRKKK